MCCISRPSTPSARPIARAASNATTAAEDDPGSVYAIGSKGWRSRRNSSTIWATLDDFRALVARQRAFMRHRNRPRLRGTVFSRSSVAAASTPAGSIGAPMDLSNMPKICPRKYEDIVNVDFYAQEFRTPPLWLGACAISFCSGLKAASGSFVLIIPTQSHCRSGNGSSRIFAAQSPRYDFFGRSVYAPEAHVCARPAGVHAILHLFHVA